MTSILFFKTLIKQPPPSDHDLGQQPSGNLRFSERLRQLRIDGVTILFLTILINTEVKRLRMYQRIIYYAFRLLELSGINKSHFSSRYSTRWLFFPHFPLELRMFVLVEGGKPEDPEKNSRSNDKNQRQTQSTCLISLYHYFTGSQHETHDLLKNATHFQLKSTGPTHVSFYYGFQWDCESEQCPKGHIIIVIIFLLWLTSVQEI